MAFTVRYREQVFGGLRQRSIAVEGTGLRGTATERQANGWAWFLRHPDGALAGEGEADTWDGVLRDIRGAAATGPRDGHPAAR